jgi:hypothetical protein
MFFLSLSTEWVVLGVVPTLAAAAAVALSVHAAVRNGGAVQAGLSLAVVMLCGVSLMILTRIFVAGAWPTALPHIAIAASCGIAGVQRWMGRTAVTSVRGLPPG